jgi:opacity protein-like surface antigen
MRLLLAAAAALLALATPAAADTIDEMISKGIVLVVEGMEIEVTYTPDGKFTAMGGQVVGDWRKDGDKLCTSSNFDPNETCIEYPKGKKAGDSFEVTGPMGSATIRIKAERRSSPDQE